MVKVLPAPDTPIAITTELQGSAASRSCTCARQTHAASSNSARIIITHDASGTRTRHHRSCHPAAHQMFGGERKIILLPSVLLADPCEVVRVPTVSILVSATRGS